MDETQQPSLTEHQGYWLKHMQSWQLFMFCNRKHDKIKILCWERSGFCLWQKRLEKVRFKWPRKVESDIITLTGQQLDGDDLMRLQPHERLHFSSVL